MTHIFIIQNPKNIAKDSCIISCSMYFQEDSIIGYVISKLIQYE